MVTNFGRFCRKLRIDNDELQKDMASKLGVAQRYLSEVENGKRKMPDDWLQQIPGHYELSSTQMSDLATMTTLTALTDKEKNALYAAMSVLYLNDSSDYINGLWDVLRAILGVEVLDNEGFDLKSWMKQLKMDE